MVYILKTNTVTTTKKGFQLYRVLLVDLFVPESNIYVCVSSIKPVKSMTHLFSEKL